MIQSVERAFKILEYISANGNLVRLNDIATALALRKTTVHNLIVSLKELGYVTQDELSPKYKLTSKVKDIYVPAYSPSGLRQEIRPLLKKITEKYEESCFFAIQIGMYFKYELKNEPKRSVKIRIELGKEEEMLTTAVGNMFMAHSKHLQKVLMTHTTESVSLNFDKIKKQNYALDFGEYEEELHCIAVPVFKEGNLAGVLGVSGPSYRLENKKMIEIAHFMNALLN